jgi:hypothetical protein
MSFCRAHRVLREDAKKSDSATLSLSGRSPPQFFPVSLAVTPQPIRARDAELLQGKEFRSSQSHWPAVPYYFDVFSDSVSVEFLES